MFAFQCSVSRCRYFILNSSSEAEYLTTKDTKGTKEDSGKGVGSPGSKTPDPLSGPAKGRRKILLISYHFPPSTEVGGLRIGKFAKYLPSCGWDSVVLTIDEKYLRTVDKARLEDTGNLRVIRTRKLPTLLDGYSRLKAQCGSIAALLNGHSEKSSKPATSSGRPAAESLLRRIKRYVLSVFLVMPDMERGWIIPAAFRALKEIRKGKIDCILTSCPPYSVHLIGLLVKLISKVKWVADFRDPWMATQSKRLYPTCPFSMKIESWLEKKVIQKADLTLFNVEPLRDLYKKRYCFQPEEKFQYVPNGIETELFTRLRHLQKYRDFTLTYIGSLYLGRTPEPVFKALRALADEDRIALDRVAVRLVGNCRQIGDRPTSQLIESYDLGRVVEVMDVLPYNEALEIVARSHLALLFAPEQPLQIPAKVYDYLGCGTKILAITGEGATRDLIQETGCGGAFVSEDIDGIKEFLFAAMEEVGSLATPANSSAISRYDASLTTKQLADGLNRIVSPGAQEVS